MQLFLLGMMGSGKTTVGKVLAERLGRPFYDLDVWISDQAQQSVLELFQRRGEAAFRDLETAALKQILGQKAGVVATGGGILEREENRRLLAAGIQVFLDTSLPTLEARLEQERRQRPLVAGPEWKGTLGELYRKRRPLYTAIPFCVKTDGKSVATIVAEILSLGDFSGGEEKRT